MTELLCHAVLLCIVGSIGSLTGRLWNDLYCVEWGVKLYSIQSKGCPGIIS